MKDIVFYRELKILINGVRSYGIEHCSYKNMASLMADSDKRKDFTVQVHKGFFIAQKNAIFLLRKILKEQKLLNVDLKQARREKNKDKIHEIDDLIKKAKNQWILLHGNSLIMILLLCADYTTDRN